MKKTLITLSIILIALSAKSQELGVRWGSTVENDVAIDGIYSLERFSRIHSNISFGFNSLGVATLIDFIYLPAFGDKYLYWYAGAGVSARFGDPFLLGPSGEVGLQYTFREVPVSISADWRPTFWLVENPKIKLDGFGINVRYVFGSYGSKTSKCPVKVKKDG